MRFKTLSSNLIAKYGGPVVFRHKSTGTIPVPGEGYPEIVEHTEVNALRTNPTTEQLASGAVQVGDMILLISGQDLESPDPSDTVVLDTLEHVDAMTKEEVSKVEWDVRDIVSISPDGDDILYKVQIRRA